MKGAIDTTKEKQTVWVVLLYMDDNGIMDVDMLRVFRTKEASLGALAGRMRELFGTDPATSNLSNYELIDAASENGWCGWLIDQLEVEG